MATSIRSDTAPIDVRDLGVLDYLAAWHLQREIAEARLAGGDDTLLLLEHPAVYTAGRRTEPGERPIGDDVPVIDTDRGGKITWHGPGQLVGYPILRLADPIDVVAYVRRLEELLIGVLADFAIPGVRIDGRSGVWIERAGAPADKIGAIGIRVADGVTMHGFALNCSNALEPYRAIIPCGIRDAGVTTMSRELGREVTPSEVLPCVTRRFEHALAGSLASPVPAAATA